MHDISRYLSFLSYLQCFWLFRFCFPAIKVVPGLCSIMYIYHGSLNRELGPYFLKLILHGILNRVGLNYFCLWASLEVLKSFAVCIGMCALCVCACLSVSPRSQEWNVISPCTFLQHQELILVGCRNCLRSTLPEHEVVNMSFTFLLGFINAPGLFSFQPVVCHVFIKDIFIRGRCLFCINACELIRFGTWHILYTL